MQWPWLAAIAEIFRKPEVCQYSVSPRVEEDILRFEIPDDDSMAVAMFSSRPIWVVTGQVNSQILDTLHDVSRVETGSVMAQYAVYLHLGSEVSTGIELHDKVEVFAIGETVMELGDEGVLGLLDSESSENVQFGEHMM
jgi:hypothetical protein